MEAQPYRDRGKSCTVWLMVSEKQQNLATPPQPPGAFWGENLPKHHSGGDFGAFCTSKSAETSPKPRGFGVFWGFFTKIVFFLPPPRWQQALKAAGEAPDRAKSSEKRGKNKKEKREVGFWGKTLQFGARAAPAWLKSLGLNPKGEAGTAQSR